MADFAESLGARLRTIRENLGLPRAVVAARAGLHRNFLGVVERGQQAPSVESLIRIADALGVKAGSLIDSPAEGIGKNDVELSSQESRLFATRATVAFSELIVDALNGLDRGDSGDDDLEMARDRVMSHVNQILRICDARSALALARMLRAFHECIDARGSRIKRSGGA